MKILHLSTSNQGGAAIAAKRLSDIQNSFPGVSSEFVTLKNNTIERHPAIWGKILSGGVTRIQKQIAKDEFDLLTPVSVTQLDLKKICLVDPDVVHIHNWYNMLSISALEKISRQFKTVISVHDERLLTGGCHITHGCNQFITGCTACPQMRIGRNLIRNARNKSEMLFLNQTLNIISPSNWLADKFKNEKLYISKSNVCVIPNIVEPKRSKQILGAKNEVVQILFVAANALNPNKRLGLAIKSVINFAHNNLGKKFRLKIVGSRPYNIRDIPENLEIFFDLYLSEEHINDLMIESDILLLTSESENSPNVIVEAQLAGLFVVATNVGGVGELIRNLETGILCDASGVDLSEALSRFLSLPELELQKILNKSKLEATERHDPKKLAIKTFSFYEQCGRVKSL